MEFIDLRSDTVTKPTPAMREAMAKAEVGDDVFGEDPSINKLQKMAAEKMGKEAGLFVPSGTMGNLIAVLVHCRRGDEAIMGDLGHTFLFEGGGVAALGGVMPHTIPNQPNGTLALEDIQGALRNPEDVHHPISRLVILENTHNRCGGVPLSAAYTQKVGEMAAHNGLKLHLDGARIFNAAVALGVPAIELTSPVDSVTLCLSKALCAPVGSVLCGTEEFIRQARRIRKQLGGGMRQAGILAAAGIVALETMIDRLAEDHRRARELAVQLSEVPGIYIDGDIPPSNMVFLRLDDAVGMNAKEISAQLLEDKIKVMPVGLRRFRLVTHYWIDDESLTRTAKAFGRVLK